MPGWFKGMENIIKERGLWPEKGLNAQCEGFKCESGKVDCCCRRLLFSQPDFVNQKSHLEELITSRGHICDFYPKYHCSSTSSSSIGELRNWLTEQARGQRT